MDDFLKEGDVVKFSEQGILYCIRDIFVWDRRDKFKLHIDAMRAIAAVRFQVTELRYDIAGTPVAYVCNLSADPNGWYSGYHAGECVGVWSCYYLELDAGVVTQTRRLTVKVATPEKDRDG